MSRPVVTTRPPTHPFAAEPRHAALLEHPDFKGFCGHVFRDEHGERICILPEDKHDLPGLSMTLRVGPSDQERIHLLGFALQKVFELTLAAGDMTSEPDALEGLDGRTLLAHLQLIHDVASKALAQAGNLP